MKSYPSRVFVFGGTHGNEWTGVFAVRKYEKHFQEKYPDLDLQFIWANPEAHEINRRFKDEDLNRAFQFLGEVRPHSYEHHRARELRALIDAGPCFIIDLHTTTSNMGKTLILTDYDPLNLHVSSLVTEKFADARIIGSPDPHKKYLASQSKQSLMIEVGPVANGIIDPVVLEGTVALLDTVLGGLNSLPEKLTGTFDLYEEIEDHHYPADENKEINGYIHSEFQGKDFTPLKGKIAVFRTFKGEEIFLDLKEELYPIFINEAAYYPQQQAFTLCRKKKMQF